MTATEQREQLHQKLWNMAEAVRGPIDGWDFKQFVLGLLFYRFISEHFEDYASDDEIHYREMADDEIDDEMRTTTIEEKGYFIYPSQLFSNVLKRSVGDEDLNIHLREIFEAIEDSATGTPSEQDVKGLFADFDTSSTRLGNTVSDRNQRLLQVMQGVAELDFGEFGQHQIDLFGDAYEFLISKYASNAGKSGGEFFTPQQVSKLIARLATFGQSRVNKIYDPACGSGSLLLQARRLFQDHLIEGGFYGQECNPTTYNLARMNMFLHGINYDKFDIRLGDTLLDPKHLDERPFDAIVSNPPYSLSWNNKNDPTLINDHRYAPAGILAPKGNADYAFILHSLYHLSARGRAAIVCFPGIFYRLNAEQKIRKYLVDNNYVECVISLPPNLFYGTSIAVNILTLSKSKPDTSVRFIDASGPEFYSKETNNNILKEEHIEEIIRLFHTRDEVEHIARSVDQRTIQEQDYNLSVGTYVEPRDTREVIDIEAVNAEVAQTVERITRLRSDIDAIIQQLQA